MNGGGGSARNCRVADRFQISRAAAYRLMKMVHVIFGENEQAAQDIRDEEVPEGAGGPFVETSGRSEFAYGTDASNPKDAERVPFPTTRREK